jgi:hypothetical protein
MIKSNYDLVYYVIESYDNEDMLVDFESRFVKGENIDRKDYNDFCSEYVGDSSDWYYIDLNWKYIESGGDESVFEK